MFWRLDLSEWNKYEIKHIYDMDLPTKPAANLFFEFSRSFGIWVGIGDDTEFGYMEDGGLEILALDGIELYGCQRGFVRAAWVPRWAINWVAECIDFDGLSGVCLTAAVND